MLCNKLFLFILFLSLLQSANASDTAAAALNNSFKNHEEVAGDSKLMVELKTKGCETEDDIFKKKLEKKLKLSDDKLILPILITYATCLVNTHSRSAEAIEILSKALAIDPEYHDTHLLLGTAYFQQGEDELAIRHFEKAIELKPTAEIHRRLALSLIREVQGIQGLSDPQKRLINLADARHNIELATSLDPENPMNYSHHALLLRFEGKSNEAIPMLEAAIEKTRMYSHYSQRERDFVMADFYVQVGELYLNTGDKTKGRQTLKKGLALAPSQAYKDHLQLIIDANAKKFFDPFSEPNIKGGKEW